MNLTHSVKIAKAFIYNRRWTDPTIQASQPSKRVIRGWEHPEGWVSGNCRAARHSSQCSSVKCACPCHTKEGAQ